MEGRGKETPPRSLLEPPVALEAQGCISREVFKSDPIVGYLLVTSSTQRPSQVPPWEKLQHSAGSSAKSQL